MKPRIGIGHNQLPGVSYGSCVAVVILIATSLSGLTQSKQLSARFILESNGDFSAENGLFYAEAARIHFYSHVPVAEDPKTHKRVPTLLNDGLEKQWKGQPYYHEIRELRDGKWAQVSRSFSNSPDQYLDFGPCDPMNQLDISFQHSDVKALLPSSVLLKDVTEIMGSHAHYFTVVYSDTPDTQVKYSLKLSLIIATGKGLHLEGTQYLGADGQFCGTRGLGEFKLSNGQTADDLLVYLDEPGGSSNYIRVLSYLVKKTD